MWASIFVGLYLQHGPLFYPLFCIDSSVLVAPRNFSVIHQDILELGATRSEGMRSKDVANNRYEFGQRRDEKANFGELCSYSNLRFLKS